LVRDRYRKGAKEKDLREKDPKEIFDWGHTEAKRQSSLGKKNGSPKPQKQPTHGGKGAFYPETAERKRANGKKSKSQNE